VAKLLLIEDDPGVQDYFKVVVRRMGHELTTAFDGSSGIKLVEDVEADVIMTDLNMPGDPNGMELVRRIREARPNTPLIVVSGFPTKERLQECKDLGVDDFLTKPFEMTFFNSVITRLLEQRGA
jgi:CheY-like chemotaxis protein